MTRLSPAIDTVRIRDDTMKHPKSSSDCRVLQSTIGIFPSDLLSLIFQYAYPPPLFDGKYHCPDTDSLQNLSLVSRHWHRTLMATSELWTSINIPMEGTDTSKYADALVSFVDKTRSRSLSLSLDYSGLIGLNDDVLLHPSVDAIILNSLKRIENLQLVQPPRAWFSNLHHLDRIDHLSLYQVEGNPLHLSLDCIPSLSKFTLANANIRLTNSCLVTSLTLIGVPLNNCFNIIANCPKLTKLHLEDYDSSGQQELDDVLPEEVFPPQRLEVLVWKVFSIGMFAAPWQAAILNRLDVGSLQTFAWHQPPTWTFRICPHGQRLMMSLCNLFARLPPSLTCLEFIQNAEDIFRSGSRVIQSLQHDGGITSLKFSECNIPFILSIFEKLVSPQQFPRLETITMSKIIWPHPRRDETMEALLSQWFLKILIERLKPTEGRLAVYLEDDALNGKGEGSNYAWLERIELEVVSLRNCGRQIQIFVASKPVEWL